MCESSRWSWLIVTPRFLILVLDVNEMPSSVCRWLDNVILNCLGPTRVNGEDMKKHTAGDDGFHKKREEGGDPLFFWWNLFGLGFLGWLCWRGRVPAHSSVS